MEIKVLYHSKTGNTKKVGEAIADALSCQCGKIPHDGSGVAADLLILGAAVYATHDHGLDPEMINFIRTLNPAKVKRVAVYCTGFSAAAAKLMEAGLRSRGLKVSPESFYCEGKFLLFKAGHPNAADLDRARAFGKDIVKG